jgi:hypothetical protein
MNNQAIIVKKEFLTDKHNKASDVLNRVKRENNNVSISKH